MADIKSFILNDDSAMQMVQFAEELARNIPAVSMSQVRNIYGTVKKLEMQTEFDEKAHRQLVLLKPKLAYAKARLKEQTAFAQLEKALGEAIEAVDKEQPETFKRFCEFFEAILAYHKVYQAKR